MKPIRIARIATMCMLAALFASCMSSRHDPKWVEATVEPPNETVLWQVSVRSLQKTGFPIGSGLERDKLRGTSGWDTSLAPFKGEGFRERCHFQYSSAGGKRYLLKVRVEHETNEDIMHPLDISYAEWEEAPDNEARARMLVGQVKAFLGPDFKTAADQGEPQQ